MKNKNIIDYLSENAMRFFPDEDVSPGRPNKINKKNSKPIKSQISNISESDIVEHNRPKSNSVLKRIRSGKLKRDNQDAQRKKMNQSKLPKDKIVDSNRYNVKDVIEESRELISKSNEYLVTELTEQKNKVNRKPGSVYKDGNKIYFINEAGKAEALSDYEQPNKSPNVAIGGGLGERDVRAIVEAATGENTENTKNESGIEFTGGFAGKPLTNSYVWQAGTGINITSTDASNEIFKTFSMDRSVHLAVDTPYWSDPVPADHIDKGVFGGSYLPADVPTVFDYVTVDSDTYEDGSNVVTTGGLDMSNFKVGDTVRVRFDFNAIPQIANTTIEPAIWYKNRDASDNVTFTFPLTASPIFFGTGTVGKTYLNRTEISIYIASQEDINALAYFSIKSDNLITIQPLSSLVTLVR